MLTDGFGGIARFGASGLSGVAAFEVAWDNHLIVI
jgi:hypothetical protein